MTPPETVDPLDSVNAILAANVREQKLLTESLRQPILTEKRTKKRYQRTLCYYIYSFFIRSYGNEKNNINEFLSKDSKVGITNVTTPKKSNQENHGNGSFEGGRNHSENDEELGGKDGGKNNSGK